MAMDESTSRVILWGVPMCLSTVFTRCMAARGNTEIFVEPYDNCHSFGPERRVAWPAQIHSADLVNDWQTYSWTKAKLEKDFPQSVFVKDMAFAMDGKYEMLPVGYRHTFMIRDPVKVWSAYRKRITQLLSGEKNGVDSNLPGDLESYVSPSSVYKASYNLMDYVRSVLHQTPVVVDADDLAAHPGETLRRYCSEVGIPYKEDMLNFAAQKGTEENKWHCSKFFQWGGEQGGFYDKAMKSHSFLVNKTEYRMEDLPPDVVECVKRNQPWYEKMYALRLKPE
ncbi:uncharacterized protein [Asterias amurensis]|uniref:uncharacterized protein n=1 Tax=Asterias amurensis TaxID=7602 RepID=UPI003AB1D128